MGTYANSKVEITCEDKKTANKVKAIIEQAKNNNNKDYLNYDYSKLKLSVGGTCVYLEKASGRVQNLDYQLSKLWELIKDIKGVIEMNAPVMIEGEGHFYSNEEDAIK